jgi:hypothetical protein
MDRNDAQRFGEGFASLGDPRPCDDRTLGELGASWLEEPPFPRDAEEERELELCRAEVALYRERLTTACLLVQRVARPSGLRLRVRASLAVVFELVLRRLPDRAYNRLAERLGDHRVRLGRPYRRRERREREALLRRLPYAITTCELRRLCSLLNGDVCERVPGGLRYWPLVDVDVELARVRRETDAD